MAKESLEELAHPEYWNTRYSKPSEDKYDWLRTFEAIRPFLLKHLPEPSKESKILQLGCGNSYIMITPVLDGCRKKRAHLIGLSTSNLGRSPYIFRQLSTSDALEYTLTADLSSLGHRNQTSIDFSPVVIQQMESKHPGLDWKIMDVRHMTFADSSFDVAIDKATLDAMLYGSLWDPEDDVKKNVGAYVDEVARVLKPGGKWLYITWRQPHFIKPLLHREEVWTVEPETLAEQPGGGGMLEYFGFVMTKFGSQEENLTV